MGKSPTTNGDNVLLRNRVKELEQRTDDIVRAIRLLTNKVTDLQTHLNALELDAKVRERNEKSSKECCEPDPQPPSDAPKEKVRYDDGVLKIITVGW